LIWYVIKSRVSLLTVGYSLNINTPINGWSFITSVGVRATIEVVITSLAIQAGQREKTERWEVWEYQTSSHHTSSYLICPRLAGEVLSDNCLKQAQFNIVVPQSDENGPGGI